MDKECLKTVHGEDETIVSEEDIDLRKKQMDFEKKKASGELELEKKGSKEPSWLKWIIVGLVIIGLGLMIYFMDLI
jgi:copper chaperone CopZ